MQKTAKDVRVFDRNILFGLRVALLAVALVAGAFVSEGVLELWQTGGQGQVAK